MKCFYHGDLDGQASAFSVHAWAGIYGPHEHGNCMFEINYGTEFPFDIILPDEQVWIVDFSIDPEDMLKLLSITENVTWIDHHKTAIEKYKDFGKDIRGVRKSGEAGCVLTWKYLHWWTGRGQGTERLRIGCPEGLEVPRVIELVGDRDVWTWAYGDETRRFFAGSQLHDTSPESKFWWNCMAHETKDIPLPNTGNKNARIHGEIFWLKLLSDGETILKYKKQTDKSVNESIGFECSLGDYSCWAINRGRCSSDRMGGRISEYDAVISYGHDGSVFTVSLYSEKIDVSEIAKTYGGGGHKGAAGFQCKKLPFTVKASP
jgi:oligoribonuclease NrnB/cAMP/cGMP phosphodiesterase (DHH superfamily)